MAAGDVPRTGEARLSEAPSRAARRLPEIDRLRGLVMALMALDHMRDYFDADTLRFSPTDPARTYPALYLTRFVTHFCAPTFALLAGVGAYLHGARLNDPPALARFLASRGLWLIALDIFIVSPAWGSGGVFLGALWAIGCGLVALAPLSLARPRVALWVGAALIAGHNLLDGVAAADLGFYAPAWRLLHERGALPFGVPGRVSYPALPWIGVVALGYGLGPLFQKPQAQRDGLLRLGGGAALVLFLALRGFNLYGDPRPWAPQADAAQTAYAAFNVAKYPPSLQFLLMTLGVAAFLLPALEKVRGRIGDALALYGRTPLFFYVFHLYFGLAAALSLALARGWSVNDVVAFAKSGAPPADFGAGLAGAYIAWALVVLALYPLCRWFDGLKRRHPDWWWLAYF